MFIDHGPVLTFLPIEPALIRTHRSIPSHLSESHASQLVKIKSLPAEPCSPIARVPRGPCSWCLLALAPSDAGPHRKRSPLLGPCMAAMCKITTELACWDSHHTKGLYCLLVFLFSPQQSSKPQCQDPDRLPCLQVRQLRAVPFIDHSHTGLTSVKAIFHSVCRFSAMVSVA